MSRVVSIDLAQGASTSTSTNTTVMNTLVTKYCCFRRPDQLLPAAATRGRQRYLTSLWVFGSREVNEPESSPSISSSMLIAGQSIIDHQMIKEKIIAALTKLSFREPRVLIQFWSPVAVGKRCLLTTLDQPFGLGMVDEGLYFYRLESEHHMSVVDGEYDEKELGPPGRVYRQKLPEWTFDVQTTSTKHNVQDRAARYNIRGYIDLPVFEPCSGCCVGVLELITSSDYLDYAFEVQEVSRALKDVNLKSPNVFDDPSFCVQVGDERKQHELDEIFRILKIVCDIQKLPLGQTWALSGYSSFVAISGNLQKSCSSFNRSCMGKACMATASLPFYVRDLSMWCFHEACGERHLERSQGVVGRSLSSHGSCFCGDITKLSENEYPLVHIARMNRITGCLGIYLQSVEGGDEYVIELFLPPHITKKTDLQILVETVTQQIKSVSGMQLGNISSTAVIGGVSFNGNPEAPPLPKVLLLTGSTEVPLESENLPLMVENEQNDVEITCTKKQSEITHAEDIIEDKVENDQSNSAAEKSYSVIPYTEKKSEDFVTNTEKRSDTEQRRKRKRTDRSISFEEIEQQFGKTMEEAAFNLHVSRSTLKRICRSLGIIRWPYSKSQKGSDSFMDSSNQTDEVFHASDGAPTLVPMPSNNPSGTTDKTNVPATFTMHGKQNSTSALQQEQASLPDVLVCANRETTYRGKLIENIESLVEKGDLSIENGGSFTPGREIDARTVTIKATYRDDTVKFPFNLSQGLVKLEELVATRFQLKVGSFGLKYQDEEGDLILIACENDLRGLLGVFRQSVIKLFVQPVPYHI